MSSATTPYIVNISEEVLPTISTDNLIKIRDAIVTPIKFTVKNLVKLSKEGVKIKENLLVIAKSSVQKVGGIMNFLSSVATSVAKSVINFVCSHPFVCLCIVVVVAGTVYIILNNQKVRANDSTEYQISTESREAINREISRRASENHGNNSDELISGVRSQLEEMKEENKKVIEESKRVVEENKKYMEENKQIKEENKQLKDDNQKLREKNEQLSKKIDEHSKKLDDNSKKMDDI